MRLRLRQEARGSARETQTPFVFVVTQAKLNARITPQSVALLSAHGTVASAIIQDRVIYASAMTDGRTVMDIEPKGPRRAGPSSSGALSGKD